LFSKWFNKKKRGIIKNNIKCYKKNKYLCKILNFNKNNKYSRPTYSYYYVKREYIYNNKYYSLIIIRIFTGMTHQIRLHMLSLGCSIVTDDKYANKLDYKNNLKICKRMFLHNFYLKFKYENTDYKILCKLPKDLQSCLSLLKLVKTYKNDKNIFKLKLSNL
jgi:23S rRNA-/tRNA-specific pseudouridylate synthase